MNELDRINRFDELLQRLEHDQAQRLQRSRERAKGAGTMIAVLIVVLGSLALANLYFVNALTQEGRVVIAQMNEMTRYVETVSERMHSIRDEVNAMNTPVALMPVIGEQMHALAQQVARMERSIGTMRQSTTQIDGHIGGLDTSFTDMATRFRVLNSRLNAMRHDVEQMARPVP